MHVVFRDVGRVADDKIKLFCIVRQGLIPVALIKLHGRVQTAGVVPGDFKRSLAVIGGNNLSYTFQRQRNRAAVGAARATSRTSPALAERLTACNTSCPPSDTTTTPSRAE